MIPALFRTITIALLQSSAFFENQVAFPFTGSHYLSLGIDHSNKILPPGLPISSKNLHGDFDNLYESKIDTILNEISTLEQKDLFSPSNREFLNRYHHLLMLLNECLGEDKAVKATNTQVGSEKQTEKQTNYNERARRHQKMAKEYIQNHTKKPAIERCMAAAEHHSLAGQIYSDNENHPAASDAYKIAGHFYKAAGHIYEKTGELTLATQAYETAGRTYERVLDARVGAEDFLGIGLVYAMAAKAYAKADNWSRAITFHGATALTYQAIARAHKTTLIFYLANTEAALHYEAAGDYLSGEKRYEEASEHYMQAGKARSAAGNHELATRNFEKASVATAHENLEEGNIYFNQGHYQAAANAYAEAGKAYRATMKFREACTAYEKACQAYKKAADAYTEAGEVLLASKAWAYSEDARLQADKSAWDADQRTISNGKG